MEEERSLVLVKPDGVERGLVGEVIGRFERRGLKIVNLRMLTMSRDMAEQHYAEHKGKGFYPGLIDYITSGPLVAMEVAGWQAIRVVRAMVGATDPVEAAPGTIRGDLALLKGENIIHASDSPGSAERELQLFFPGRGWWL
ncbi:MAG: nucleoside-diphosphate kinase [Negativicutes bacterium]|nr:nucleoside-diphosphate kinase [Negativicutes bacterium]